MSEPRRTRAVVRWTALGAMVLSSLAIGEGAARVLHGAPRRPAKPPIQIDVRNREGFHDAEHAHDKPTGTFRIMCLGDSFTFARGVPLEHTYCRSLGHRLEEAHAHGGDRKTVETLSLGFEGLSTVREVGLLERRKELTYDPDVLVLGYVLNDPEDEYDVATFRRLREPTLPRSPRGLWASATRVSRLADLIFERLENTRRYRALQKYYRKLHRPSFAGWQKCQGAFARLAELTRARKTRVLVVIFPMLDFPLGDRYPFRELHAQVAKLARDSGFEVLDLLPVFAPTEGSRLLLAPGVDSHPSAEGHEIAARAIADAIEKLGWLTPP